MLYKAVDNIYDLVEAWQLIYKVYLDSDFIKSNRYEIFCHPEYIQQDTAVIIGQIGKEITSTLSIVIDHGKLPLLDEIYPTELAELRKNHRLAEVGLYANSCKNASKYDLLNIWSYAIDYLFEKDVTCLVCGVNPKNINLYNRTFNLAQIGKICNDINPPICLITGDRGRVKESLGYKIIQKNGYAKIDFSSRLIITRELIKGTIVEDFLNGTTGN